MTSTTYNYLEVLGAVLCLLAPSWQIITQTNKKWYKKISPLGWVLFGIAIYYGVVSFFGKKALKNEQQSSEHIADSTHKSDKEQIIASFQFALKDYHLKYDSTNKLVYYNSSKEDSKIILQELAKFEKKLEALSIIEKNKGNKSLDNKQKTLKERALLLSTQILKFVSDLKEPPSPKPDTWTKDVQASNDYYLQTKKMFSLNFGAKVISIHDELKENGLEDNELNIFYENPTNPLGMTRVGERIGALALKLK